MGICGPRWRGSLRLSLSQLSGALHPANFSLSKITAFGFIGRRRLGPIGIRTAQGASRLLVVGSVGSGPIPS